MIIDSLKFAPSKLTRFNTFTLRYTYDTFPGFCSYTMCLPHWVPLAPKLQQPNAPSIQGLYLDRGGVDGHFCLGFHACLEQGNSFFFSQKTKHDLPAVKRYGRLWLLLGQV